MRSGSRLHSGFTLIELLVVMAIVATLLSLVAPSYFGSIDKGKETALEANLYLVRDSIDKFYADRGAYPHALLDLVEHRYLRQLPKNPFASTDQSWELVAHPAGLPGIYDIRSAVIGIAPSGRPLNDF